MSFNVIIAGSRNLPVDPNVITEIKRIIIDIIQDYGEDPWDTVIVSGGANGADRLGEEIAMEQGYEIRRFIPNWEPVEGYPVKHNKYGKPYNPIAGHMRNREMAEHGHILIAIWDGGSKGTENMISQMKSLDKTVFVINF